MTTDTRCTQPNPPYRPAAQGAPASGGILPLACLAAFMASLDVTIVNVALPSIQGGLGGTMASLQWIGAGYTLIFGCLLLACGTLCDKYGAQRIFFAGVLLFSASSLACGLATGPWFLNIARLFQGTGAAMIVPATLAMLRQTYTDSHARSRAIAFYAASGGIAQVAGPVLGGVLVSTLGWRWIFFINVPLGLAILFALSRTPFSRIVASRPLDLPGQLIAIAWLTLLAASLIEGGNKGWLSPIVLAGLTASCLALAALVAFERRAPFPMFPLHALKKGQTKSILAIAAILGFSYFGLFFLLAIFFQEAQGASPVMTGLAFLPMTIGVTVSNLIIGPRLRGIGSHSLMLIGQILCAIGYLAFAGIGPGSSYLHIGALFAMIGLGGGLIVPAMTSAMLEAVPPEQGGIASGLINAARQMGSVIGIALFGSLTAQSGLVSGLRQSLGLAAVLMLVGAVLALPGSKTAEGKAQGLDKGTEI